MKGGYTLECTLSLVFYLAIRGGSLKKIEKKIIPNVPINKKVYTKASINMVKNFFEGRYLMF